VVASTGKREAPLKHLAKNIGSPNSPAAIGSKRSATEASTASADRERIRRPPSGNATNSTALRDLDVVRRAFDYLPRSKWRQDTVTHSD